VENSSKKAGSERSFSTSEYHDIWKFRILNRTIGIVFIGSAIAIALWLYRLRGIDAGGIMGIIFALLILGSLHPAFSWRSKAILLIFNFTLVGMYFPCIVGPRYAPFAIASAGCITAAAFFGHRVAFLIVAADFLGIVAYGILAHLGLNNIPDISLSGDSIFMTWFKAGVVFLTVNLLLSMIVRGLVDSLETSLERLKRVSEVSNLNEQKFRRLIDNAPEAITVLDMEKNKFVLVNSMAEKFFGYSAAEMMHLNPFDVSPEYQEDGRSSAFVAREVLDRAMLGETPVFEWIHLNKDGEKIPCEIRLLRLPGDGAPLVRGSITDIRERKKQQAIIQSLALYDNLTGLPNRKLFQDRLQHAQAASERDLKYGALFFIDVDDFKNINDSSGHASGDYFLTVVAERISASVKESDTVARWGGDEFVVIVENLSGSISQAGQAAEKIGEKILEAINVPILNPYAKGQYYQNSVSIGITLMYGHIHTADELLKRADIAMYQAKLGGKNRLRNFDVEMQRLVEERLALEADLKQALRNNEFELHFQPQYNSQRVIFGAEILLRWRHGIRGMVYPSDFIPLAEETGDIVEIGKWIIRMACVKLQEWSEQDRTKHLVLAINVSPRQFREAGFAEIVGETVRQSGINPSALKLELTESLMLENVDETIEKMEYLKKVGVGFSLDDFGTGYSSLAYLKRLPFSQLKIDQSFVRDLTTDKNDAVLIRTIIGMAENLNLQVLAEGVETAEQLAALLEMGCHAYQGFHFSRPVPLMDFEKLLLL
jgi:diguanylate cyclase (GGDEF)-like protein/PAS domain S-box-containing protein